MVFETYDYLKSVLGAHNDVRLEEGVGLITVVIKTLPGIDCKKEKRPPKFVRVTSPIHFGCALYSYEDEVSLLIDEIKKAYPETHSLTDLREYIVLKNLVSSLEESILHSDEYNPWSGSYKKH